MKHEMSFAFLNAMMEVAASHWCWYEDDEYQLERHMLQTIY